MRLFAHMTLFIILATSAKCHAAAGAKPSDSPKASVPAVKTEHPVQSSPEPHDSPAPTAANVTSPMPTSSPSAAPTAKPTKAPTPRPVPSPTTSPTSAPLTPPHGMGIWRFLGQALAWLILLGLAVITFGAVMTHRYRIYFFLRGVWYTVRQMPCTQWIKRKVLRRNVGGGHRMGDAGINTIIFDNEMNEGLLMREND